MATATSKKTVSPALAARLLDLHAALAEEFGCDFAYTVLGQGIVLSSSSLHGITAPTTIPQRPKAQPVTSNH